MTGDDLYMNENKRPVLPHEPADDNGQLLKYCCPSASWEDMTGLVPYSACSGCESEAYSSLYPYLPEDLDGSDAPAT